MPNEDTNEPTAPVEQEETVEQPVVAEETAQAEEVVETTEVQEEPSEEIDINKFWEERYPAQTQTDTGSLRDEVAQELSQLPTDETGTVEANAAAEWFANKLSQVEQRANKTASSQAEKAAMSVIAEQAQQQQLLKKYPEITKDRDTLDAIFDLRDAAALRGQNVSLMEAAAKLDKLRTNARSEGQQSATRQTTIQAAAHLETASTKGAPQAGQRERLAVQAYEGRGQEAKNARQELLKQFVQNEIKDGRIQHP